jgi:HNH endonuclease/NUMOD4 motif
MTKEEWKDVVGYEGISRVSTLGRVFNYERRWVTGKGTKRIYPDNEVPQSVNGPGYLYVQLRKNNKQKKIVVHRLVAIAFIPNPLNKREVNHKNGIKTDNNVNNLEWVSSKENSIHAVRTGLRVAPKGVNHGSVKLTEEEVRYIIRSNESSAVLSQMFSVSKSNINVIQRRASWKHLKS